MWSPLLAKLAFQSRKLQHRSPALGAQLFLFLLHVFDTYVLAVIGGYDTIDVEAAQAMAKAPQLFTRFY